MRESIANSYIFNLIIVFVGILIVLLVGSLSYSKTFKIKTRIIEIIEKYETYNNGVVRTEINTLLSQAGYKVTRGTPKACPSLNGQTAINNQSNYRYCIYKFSDVRGYYYTVTVFISFEFPVIGDVVEFPLTGQTRPFIDI
ncbi:MAG: hypothetical protein ACM3O4_01830 [Ignavibacteriales bacterium]